MTAPKIENFHAYPDAHGHFGRYGGRFVAETLIGPLQELSAAYDAARVDGATGLKKLLYVSLPLQLPIALIAVLFGIVFTATRVSLVQLRNELQFRNYFTGAVVRSVNTNRLDRRKSNEAEYYLQGLIDYNRVFDVHAIAAMVGYDQTQRDFSEIRAIREGFYANSLPDFRINRIEGEPTAAPARQASPSGAASAARSPLRRRLRAPTVPPAPDGSRTGRRAGGSADVLRRVFPAVGPDATMQA